MLEEGFTRFFSNTKSPSHLFWCKDDKRLNALRPPGLSYGFSPDADLTISAFEQQGAGIRFDLFFKKQNYSAIELSLFGRHNALNGAAVFGLALQLGVSEELIRKAFKSFSGAKRRLEFKGEAHKVKIFDDYGHHPIEIQATLKALRGKVRERRLIAIFQPHRYSRVKDLFSDFLTCFHDADLVVLTDIYSAGEAPIVGITTAALYTKMKEALGAKLHFFPRQHLEVGVAALLKPLDVALTIGAGDVTKCGQPILQLLAERRPKLRVGVIFGGPSAEHEVSTCSAINVSAGLDAAVYDVSVFKVAKQGHWADGSKMTGAILEALLKLDVAIPVFHGPQGEDGMIQGFLDTLQIPYAGCDYASSALAMHKVWSKNHAIMHGIPTAPFLK